MDSAKKFKSALNVALSRHGGVFWEDIKDVQLQGLLKKLTKSFFEDNKKIMRPVTNVGRQSAAPNIQNADESAAANIQNADESGPDKDIYVLNERTQVS